MKQFVLAEFSEPEQMVAAARWLHEAGRQGLDAYSPYPVHGIDEALKLPRSKVPLVALIAGLTGATGGYLLQWWTNAVDYELNVGNRPPHAWPTNIPVTFESGVLICALTIFFGSLFYFFGLPRTYHPVFEAEEFRSASLDKFWISAELTEGESAQELERTLRELGAQRVTNVRGED
jgi:ActD protein